VTIRGSGADMVTGASTANTIDGGLGNDTLAGGLGADVFVYASSYGNDVVTDFSIADGDKIDLSGLSGVNNFTQISASHLAQDGSDAVITDDSGDTLILQGVDKDDLTSSQFIF